MIVEPLLWNFCVDDEAEESNLNEIVGELLEKKPVKVSCNSVYAIEPEVLTDVYEGLQA